MAVDDMAYGLCGRAGHRGAYMIVGAVDILAPYLYPHAIAPGAVTTANYL